MHAAPPASAASRSPGLDIRAARERDARALVRLQREIYREGRWFVGDGPPAPDTLARRLRGLDPAGSLYLAAFDGAEAAAWMELHRLQPERLRHVAVLTIAVGRRWRRRGLGRELMRRAERWARRTGVRKISLNVRAGNEAALALYASLGFEREGLERGQVRTDDGGFEDNVIMALRLEPPADATPAAGDGRPGR